MGFGKQGARGGFGSGGVLGGAWWQSGAAADLDFAGGRYFGGSLSSLLTLSRASSKTNLFPSSPSGYAYSTFLSNVLPITPGIGLSVEGAATNLLLNSTAPATQTTASLGTGTYVLWVNGSGSATPSGGTATITGGAAATNGSPNVFTVTVAGTVVVTVAGALNAFQLEVWTTGTSGIAGSSFIQTGGVTANRAADALQAAGAILAAMKLTAGAIRYNVNIPALLAGNAAIGGGADAGAFALYMAQTTFIPTSTLSSVANLAAGSRAIVAGANEKISAVWKASNYQTQIGGGTPGTSANATVPTAGATYYFGSNAGVNRFANLTFQRITVSPNPVLLPTA